MKYGNKFDRNDLDIIDVYYLYYRDKESRRPKQLVGLFEAQGVMYFVAFVCAITFIVFFTIVIVPWCT
ncbi:hypothetical protein IID19_05630 [Patescibacteria group bacterium]|nr:hypothetical protein [Patescibacteria group bacterium]